MPKELPDYVEFCLPTDHELQFPAIAVLQEYVNKYDDRMKVMDVSGGTVVNKLHYWVADIPDEDWRFFIDAGLLLYYLPDTEFIRALAVPDMVIDMRDGILDQFRESGKHACQICTIMAGVTSPAFPTLRKVMPDMTGSQWGVLGGVSVLMNGMKGLTVEELLVAKDGQWTGIIGEAGRGTYLAAAFGLPVIEVIPKGRSRNWLSKWSNMFYRVVDHSADNPRQIAAAMSNLEGALRHVFSSQPSVRS